MFDSQSHQGDLPLHVDPVLTVAAVTAKRNELFAVSNPIMTKPKPVPVVVPPTPTPAPTPAPSEGKHSEEEGKGDKGEKDAPGSKGEGKMDVDE